jgi:hypothetical protein
MSQRKAGTFKHHVFKLTFEIEGATERYTNFLHVIFIIFNDDLKAFDYLFIERYLDTFIISFSFSTKISFCIPFKSCPQSALIRTVQNMLFH